MRALSAGEPPANPFSTSGNGQELYCLLDAGYVPRGFVFGNVAYSIGVGRGVFGALKTLARGEIKEYSDIFNTTRHLALARIVAEARRLGANAVVGIETRVMPFQRRARDAHDRHGGQPSRPAVVGMPSDRSPAT